MNILRLCLLSVFLVGCSEANVGKDMSGYEIVSFNTNLKSLELAKLDNGKLLKSFPLENMELINPLLIENENNNSVSVIEYAPNGEIILDLETGDFTRNSKSYGTYIINEKLRFYFESRQGMFDDLVKDLNGDKEVIHTLKKSSVSKPRLAPDGSISWFFRREHSLVVYNQEGKVNIVELADCRDAVWLGFSNEILCVNETKGLSKTGISKGSTVLNDDLIFSSISTNLNDKEVYLSSISTSLSADSLLMEFHDIYLFDVQTNQIRLLKERAVMHGTNYFVRKRP